MPRVGAHDGGNGGGPGGWAALSQSASAPTEPPLFGGAGILPLLDFGNEQMDSLGSLFHTLLALQARGNSNNDFLKLFSGVEL